jgi:hypothetical protein
LSANFSDVLPPDEDQMPANGNPHPIPGQMQQDNTIFSFHNSLNWDGMSRFPHFLRCKMTISFSQSRRILVLSKYSRNKYIRSKFRRLMSKWKSRWSVKQLMGMVILKKGMKVSQRCRSIFRSILCSLFFRGHILMDLLVLI